MVVYRRAKLGVLALAVVSLAALVALWSYREPIAQNALDSYFAQHGVEASYEIKAIETRRQRLEHVRLGPRDAPDLVADWLEIDVGPSFSGLSVKAVRAGGVRLHGRSTGKNISFGTLDRLIPASPEAEFRLPDIDVSLEDGRMRIESPYGPLGVRLDGQGNLRAGFEGKLAAIAPSLAQAECVAQRVTLYGDFSIVAARPTFAGPLRFADARCKEGQVQQGVVQLSASIAEDGADWRGTGDLLSAASVGGGWRAQQMRARLDFKGDARATRLTYKAALASVRDEREGARNSGVSIARLSLDGDATLGNRGILLKSKVEADGLGLGRDLNAVASKLQSLRDTAVIGPVARNLGEALARSARTLSGSAHLAFSRVDGRTAIAASDIGLESASGARLRWDGQDVVQFGANGLVLQGAVRFGGGGLPAGQGVMAGRGGQIVFAPYLVRGAALRLSPVRFRLEDAGLGLETIATLDGPIGAGRLAGLRIPLVLRPGQSQPSGCYTLGFQAAALGNVRLAPARLRTCWSKGVLMIAAPRLAGKMAGELLSVTAARVTARLADGGIQIRGLSAETGAADARSHFAAELVTAQSRSGQWRGTARGLEGYLQAVPIAMSEGEGTWRFAQGVFLMEGAAAVSDRSPDTRFNRLRADALHLAVRGKTLTAKAVLREPRSGAEVSQVSLQHDLSSGKGRSILKVEDLRFDDRLQPEALTPVTLGVVANVRGRIMGEGRIDWGPGGVESTGRFRTDGLDYAAAFGPVVGMKGQIAFSDLLGLVTESGQMMNIAAINPGVIVTDGTIRYQILPGYKVQVTGGRWPFAGGYLVLEPTTLDMSESAQRRLTFRVEGLDAARFIAAMDFENIAATGIYDGVLPMVFDAAGGRIEGGNLVARGGGTLSYVGPVSNENLGLMGRFAFDALKSIRYSRLAIELNGAIDGDVVTRIRFAGVNQAPVSGSRTKLPIKILGASNLPFIFNVTVTAQFRQLFEMARSFNDPSILINRILPQLEPVPKAEPAPPAVQPAESDQKQ